MSPERKDARRNRETLVAAAARLFDQDGPDVPLDRVARAAGVANATLYRHFPTRAELLVAVYAEEVDALEQLGERLSRQEDVGAALDEWLRAFVHHVATKRGLALALPDDGDRGARFDGWHATMREAAAGLLHRAQRDGAAKVGVDADDLLALAAGIALTGRPAPRLDAMLALVRAGYRA